MRLIKKYMGLWGFIVSLILVFWPTTLSAATFNEYLEITITNNNSTGYSYLPVIVSVNNSQFASYGYIQASGLDTAVLSGGTSVPYSLLTNKAVIVIPTVAGSQQGTYAYQFGRSPAQTDYPLAVGYGGYFNVSDAAALELGNAYEVELSGYINTSSGGYLVQKGNSFGLYAASGNVSLVTPPDKTWPYSYNVSTNSSMAWMYNGSTTRIAERFNGFAGTITSVTIYTGVTGAPPGNMSLIAYNVSDGAALGTIGTATANQAQGYKTFNSTPLTISVARDIYVALVYTGGDVSNRVTVGYQNGNPSSTGTYYHYTSAVWNEMADLDIKMSIAFTAAPPVSTQLTTAVASGEHTVKVVDNGATTKLYIDTVEQASMAAASIPNTAAAWDFMNGNSAPYLDYYKHTVSSVLKAWYQPVSIISPSSVTDRTGNGYSGIITYGTNPASITVSIGTIHPSSDYISAFGADADTPEVIPPGGTSVFENTSATGSNLPYYDIFDRAADAMGTSTLAVYGLMAIFIAIIMFAFISISTGSTMAGVIAAGVTSGVAASAIIGAWIVLIIGAGGLFLLYIYRRT